MSAVQSWRDVECTRVRPCKVVQEAEGRGGRRIPELCLVENLEKARGILIGLHLRKATVEAKCGRPESTVVCGPIEHASVLEARPVRQVESWQGQEPAWWRDDCVLRQELDTEPTK